MTDATTQTALLIAAHGERQPDAANESVMRLVRALSDRGLVSRVAAGFVSGVPSIKDALDALAARRILVYPLFASSGYFTRDRLVQLLDEASNRDCEIEVLPPLGLDAGVAELAVAFAKRAALKHGFSPRASTVIFLAHGSRHNSASRESARHIAREVESKAAFGEVRIAFLEEKPSLGEATASVLGPAIVVGLFSGEGLHGARDAPRLITELRRDDVVFAGVIGAAAGIEDLVARSVGEALLRDIRRRYYAITSPVEAASHRT